MKRLLPLLFLLLAFAASVSAQVRPAGQIRFGPTDPATCTPGRGQIFENTTSHVVKNCTATNTWTATGGSGNVSTTGGTANTLSKWLTSTTLGDSRIADLPPGSDLTINVGTDNIALVSVSIADVDGAPLVIRDISHGSIVKTGIIPAAYGGTGVANTGTITLGGNLIHAGGFATTITVTATTNSTLPAGTHNLAPLDSPVFTGAPTIPTPFTLGAVSVTATGTELNYVAGLTSAIQTQLNGKQASGSYAPVDSPLFTTLIQTPQLKITNGGFIYPSANATTAIRIGQADGTTAFVTFDSSNKRMGINKTPGAFDLDVNGAANFGSTIAASGGVTAGGFVQANVLTVNSANTRWASGVYIGFSSASDNSAISDVTFSRGAAKTLNIGSGTTTNDGFIKLAHIIGGSSVPTIANGAGAGTSPGTPAVAGTDMAGQITIITGTLPSVSAVAVTITFNVAYGAAPYVVIWPANAAAATLGFLPYVGSTTTTFTVNAGTIALGAATTYLYNYVVVQ